MQLLQKSFALLFFVLIANMLFSQNSIVRGTVYEDSTGEPLPGVAIVIDGTTQGTSTDFEGKFNLVCNPGTYTLKISFISYETLVYNDISLKPGQVFLLDNLRLKEAGIQLEAVTVVHEASRNTETALQTIKRKSANLIDGISASTLSRIGDSDAASSMKRITGVSVEGGKYVFVRGLGDRYTKTILNGLDIPGLDPDRNTLQMDIFPTNIIDNIIVHKTFSANLPADFTGGVIDISIKDFPEERKISFSLSTGYNKNYHFNSNYLTYQGGKKDFLGFDDGTRAIPALENIPFFAEVVGNPNGEDGQRYREILESFSPIMGAEKKTSPMDYGLGFNMGDQIVGNKITLGYNLAFSYKADTEFIENAEYGRYGLSDILDETELELREFQKGNFGKQNILLSGLGGIALKTNSSKVRVYMLHLQNGESKAGIYDYIGADKGSNFISFQHNLDYSQRSLTNFLIDGKHTFNSSTWELEWKISPTLSNINEPDSRFTRYAIRGDGLSISTESGFPERTWRNLEETNLASVVHLTKDINFLNEKGKLQFGGAYTFKERDFIIRTFAINVRNIPLTGNPNELFFLENLWPYNGSTSRGTTYESNFVPTNPNQYNANVFYASGYISMEINPLKKLKTVIGVRTEKYTQFYTGQNQLGSIVLDNEKVLDDIGIFPTLNIIYSLKENQNLRVSYSKTIARPSFKELSYAEISDPISGRTFIGGLFTDTDPVSEISYWDGKLQSSTIHNYDFRWEIFLNANQITSISLFYKQFIKPIEIVQYATQVGSFQPRNVGDGSVFGIEMDLRYNLDFISESLENFTVTSNITYTKSRIMLSQTELDSKQQWLRTGQSSVPKYREMAGQAPYLFNAGFLYNGSEGGFFKGLESGLFFNIQGITLLHTGINDRPDIYQKPFPSLNYSLSKKFGDKKNIAFDFKASNILNRKSESIFISYQAESQIYNSIYHGTSFSLGFNYQF